MATRACVAFAEPAEGGKIRITLYDADASGARVWHEATRFTSFSVDQATFANPADASDESLRDLGFAVIARLGAYRCNPMTRR